MVAVLLSCTWEVAQALPCYECKKTTASRTALQSKAAACKRAQSTSELNINNVRALINGYGNMWYDGSISQYHLPKNSTSSPLYCAALWIGGTDVNDQLRVAALTFGSNGDDYWPGPLTVDNTASVTAEICNEYDRHFKITQAEVLAFKAQFNYLDDHAELRDDVDNVEIPQSIDQWPGNGDVSKHQSPYLAPFFDANDNGIYEPSLGDYPWYDFDNEFCPRQIKAQLAPGQTLKLPETKETREKIVKGGLLSDQVLKGDQTIWWVFNDMGNTHTESKGEPIGLEIRAQAFAFSTNDEVNNMTFYSYEIINRSTYELRNTYFSQWVDPDLGYGFDDFVGCDVKRGLGYCYNGNPQDGSGTGHYSGVPPAVGIDFFQGPYMDPDGLDNPKIDIEKARNDSRYSSIIERYRLPDGSYDTLSISDNADLFYSAEDGGAWYFKKDDVVGNCAINGVNFGNTIADDERFGMRRFVYYTNGTNATYGEPENAAHFYYYLQGRWKTGQRMKYGGNALPGGEGVSNLDCDFMFPGDSDPLNWGTNGEVPDNKYWTEESVGNSPNDRRFMQSAGPFTLQPGAVNYITVGIPFAQASSGSPWSSVELLREVDDVCQSLFENCFKVLDGPEAPTMHVQELKNEVILYLSYDNPSSMGENYSEIDPTVPLTHKVYMDTSSNPEIERFATVELDYTLEQRSYVFEGYQIFQLKDAYASIADIRDETKARLVAQCDIENFYKDDAGINETNVPIGTLVNFTNNSTTGILSGQVMVQGANQGIQHVFRVTMDQFTGNPLVNNKEYYFIVVAYAQNRFKEYSQTEADKLDGQKEPYLEGRRNEWGGTITPVTAIPHDPSMENGGTIVQSEFGLMPNIQRIEGYGNGGTQLQLTEASIEELMGPKGVPGKAPGVFTVSDLSRRTPNFSLTNPCIISQPVYEKNAGPIVVSVVDPLNIKEGQYEIAFNGDNSSISNNTKWSIRRVDGQPFYDNVTSMTSDFGIGRYNEQLFLDLGIMVSVSNTKPIQTITRYDDGFLTDTTGVVLPGAVLGSSIEVADNTQQWISAVQDFDAVVTQNWIRSGNQFAYGNNRTFMSLTTPVSENEAYLDDDYYRYLHKQKNTNTYNWTAATDKDQQFEDIVNGAWAPYGLTSNRPYHPGFNMTYYLADSTVIDSINDANGYPVPQYRPYHIATRYLRDNLNHNYSYQFYNFEDLPSVRIVITNDTSKWTRCPVLEMCEDYSQSEGNAHRFSMRRHKSVDKNGDTSNRYGVDVDNPNSPAYISEYGMGWFPGYAISLETGERLNMMFGEDSRYVQHNGRDMMWNPVSRLTDGTENIVMGGRHYIYVMKSTTHRFPRFHAGGGTATSRQLVDYVTPSYDAGRWAAGMLRSLDNLIAMGDNDHNANINKGILVNRIEASYLPQRDSAMFLFSTVAWVNMPLVDQRFQFTNPQDIPCDVTINIHVKKSYASNLSANGTTSEICNPSHSIRNSGRPLYRFTFDASEATLTGVGLASNAEQSYKDSLLSMISVVPNPYYSYSQYETQSQLETKVRIINLPSGIENGVQQGATISIYTVDGTLVRTIHASPTSTTVDWNLHNHNEIPIAGGVYLIHVRVPGLGDRVIKWFGTMRPVDLNSFKF